MLWVIFQLLYPLKPHLANKLDIYFFNWIPISLLTSKFNSKYIRFNVENENFKKQFTHLPASCLSHGTWDLRCAMQDLLLHRAGPLVVALGLSCLAACGILVPRPGVKLTSRALEGRFLNHWTTREVPLMKTIKNIKR